MAESKERIIMIAMDGSSFCDYAFDCLSLKIDCVSANSADPDEMPHVAFHLGLRCLPKYLCRSVWSTNDYVKNIHQENHFVILFHCVEYHQLTIMPMAVGNAALITTMIEEERASAKIYLQKLTDKMEANHLHGKIKQVHGSPRVELIRAAEDENVNLVITGTRGMGQIRRTLLGSVSDHVLHHSHVPVLICRHKDDHHHHHHSHRGGEKDTHF